LTPLLLLNAIRNHLGKAILVFLLTVGATAAAMFLTPKEYQSRAMIFVRIGRETVSLDPTATTGSTISILETREIEVNSIRDMLHSRELHERIVDRIGPEVIQGKAPLGDVRELDSSRVEERESDFKGSPRQKAIKQLSKSLVIVSGRQSSVITLEAEAKSPELSQRILEVFLEEYQNLHTSVHQTPESNQFFLEQSNVLRKKWQEGMKNLQQAKKEAGIVSVEGAKEILNKQTEEMQIALMKINSAIKGVNAKLASYDEASKNAVNARRIRADLLELQSTQASNTAERDKVESQIEELLQRAVELNTDEVAIRQLEQEVSIAESNYAQYRELHEQTRINQEIAAGNFSNVKVVQQPSFVPKQVKPKKRVLAVLGLFAATSGAILICLLFEFVLKDPDSEKPGDPKTTCTPSHDRS